MAENPDRPLLTRLRVQNFRSLADVTVEFGPLTVLVGPNGAGKSNLVDALRFLRDAATEGLDQALNNRGTAKVAHRKAKASPVLHFSLDFEDANFRCEYNIDINSAGGMVARRVQAEEINVIDLRNSISSYTLRTEEGKWILPTNAPGEELIKALSSDMMMFMNDAVGALALDAVSNMSIDFESRIAAANAPRRLLRYMQSSRFYDFVSTNLRQGHSAEPRYPLDENGLYLSSVMSRIQDGTRYYDMGLALERLVEGAKGYYVHNLGNRLKTELLYGHQPGDVLITSELMQESDGTLRMLGILTALYQDPPLPLIVIEEPETNIHPGALGVLADVLEEASLRSQVIITTHSTDLVDRFSLEALRVVEQVGGETKVGPVREGQRKAVKQKLFSPGELMRMEGLQRAEED
jgi:predicted ATPase